MAKTYLSEINKVNNLLLSNHSPFNSILFILLDIPPNDIDINDIKDIDEPESNTSIDSPKLEKDNNKYFFLLNDLIKELNSSFLEEENEDKIQNNNNIINNSYIINNMNNYLINNNIFFPYIKANNQNIPTFPKSGKKKILIEKKGDWVCPFCDNLNFSFRTRCNRCKASKKEALKCGKKF